ncbi:hypothetical protein AB0I82_35225 [Streptomyces sp. NPDC050315]|uniref:hypothetical protein n=1 Tax=Streptomyces sp. NPDC050315 TaxID=3155039 RepID=UPI0034243309
MDLPSPMERAESKPPETNVTLSPVPQPADRREKCGDDEDVERKLLAYREHMRSRDELIGLAKKVGLTEVRIAELSGHSRNTVRNIIKQIPDGQGDKP